MNTKAGQILAIHLGAPKFDDDLTHRDFAETRQIEQPDDAKLTYYVAQDAAGDIVGTAQVNPLDRKAVGALVGNWIASGYPVSRMNYKAMNKLLREQQKVLDAAVAPAATAPAIPAAPGGSATGGEPVGEGGATGGQPQE